MTLSNEFSDVMRQTISIQSVSSNALYGPSYGAAVSYSGFVKKGVFNVLNSSGQVEVANLKIYLDGSVTVYDDDKITVSGVSSPLIRVNTMYDETGAVYATVLYCGTANMSF